MAYRYQPKKTYRRVQQGPMPARASSPEVQEQVDSMLQSLGARVMESLRYGGDQLGRLDDQVQRYARNTYVDAGRAFDNRQGSTVMGDAVVSLGDIIHAPRQAFRDDASGYMGLAASRALQAGGLTAAGAGLANLTGRMVDSFGGPADEPGPGELYM